MLCERSKAPKARAREGFRGTVQRFFPHGRAGKMPALIWKRSGPGGPRGLQNRWGRQTRPGGFDSHPLSPERAGRVIPPGPFFPFPHRMV